MAVFRAIENRRPLVRSANTGISAFIAPTGKILMQGGLFREEVLVMDVYPVRTPGGFYTQRGDLFALILSAICLINIFHALCYHRFVRRRTGKPGGSGHKPRGG
jgi:apolipoprotein N-acyltransferase